MGVYDCWGQWLVVESGVAPSWWWGVVFDLWIVVASIKPHGWPPFGGLRSALGPLGFGVGVWFVVV